MRQENSSYGGGEEHTIGENGRGLPTLGEKLILAVLTQEQGSQRLQETAKNLYGRAVF